ncbi:D-3-phosphoglycerate dehydrogenase [Rhodovastum atsumiense]|uniref:D-2-hydroxyacid dehydrogenase n=1 Tax=Rhodovastum atsumiense TaxID=504468 RepID=A0A5M6IX80_9PROT|nr:D-2-hydroxyacid dehydrogenase [Rhodovastum atsumiense]KAA5612940.1 D-2-hydroxyacid dehydrogenase [Rhodovastum atsumiense]CAH2600972.1 D-3-phosphoglycerate dehydrogenase [Rhodovastum atsumiense]
MRIHIQNRSASAPFVLTPAQWHAAAARAGETDHEVSFGFDTDAFTAAIAEAEILIASPSTIGSLLPFAGPRLRLMFTTAAGVDALRPFERLPPGVLLVNNRGVHGAKVFEYAAMALLMLNTRIPAYAAAQRRGSWEPQFLPVIRGRRATIIGTGDLGAAAARAARMLGLSTTGLRTRALPHDDFDRIRLIAELDAVLPETDFLVLACPLTPATAGLLDRRRLELLPQGAGVVNVGRGGLIDQDALCDLLDAGRLGGAVLDVTTPEPPPPDHRVWTTPNLLVTPHVSADEDPATYNAATLEVFFANLRAWRDGGMPPNQVDPGRGY